MNLHILHVHKILKNPIILRWQSSLYRPWDAEIEEEELVHSGNNQDKGVKASVKVFHTDDSMSTKSGSC